MEKMIQLNFFEENDDVSILKREFKEVKDSCDKVRKGMFVRHNSLAKMYLDISERLEKIERAICRESI